MALVEERAGADPGDPPVIARYLYTPYGEAAVAAEDIAYDSIAAASATLDGRFPGAQNCLFQGLWTDPVTGIAYARNRWYDARNASWLSEDSFGAVDSSNLYAFVGWGPNSFVDPLGEQSVRDALDWERDREQGRFFVGGMKELGYDIWNLATFGFLSKHDEAYEEFERTGDRQAYVKQTAVEVGRAGVQIGLTAVSGGAGAAAAKTVVGGVARGMAAGAASGVASTAAMDVYDRSTGGEGYSAEEYLTAAGAGALFGGAGGTAGVLAKRAPKAKPSRVSPVSAARNSSSSLVNRGVGSGGPIGWAADKFRGFKLKRVHAAAVSDVDAAIKAGDTEALLRLSGGRRGWVRSIVRGNGQAAANRGNIIDVSTKARAKGAFGIKGLEATPVGRAGPDFWNPRTLRAWDMTTEKMWGGHVNRYILGGRPFVRPSINPLTGQPVTMWRHLSPLLH
jgi:RHS repeat-associated protein